MVPISALISTSFARIPIADSLPFHLSTKCLEQFQFQYGGAIARTEKADPRDRIRLLGYAKSEALRLRRMISFLVIPLQRGALRGQEPLEDQAAERVRIEYGIQADAGGIGFVVGHGVAPLGG